MLMVCFYIVAQRPEESRSSRAGKLRSRAGEHKYLVIRDNGRDHVVQPRRWKQVRVWVRV